MSGHLLQTVNPEAAAEDQEVPPVGTRVLYHARPGFGRGGRTAFPADVMHNDPKKGTCVLWVLFGREDYKEIEHVQKVSEQNLYGWSYTEESEGMLREIDALRDELAMLRASIFGGYEEPKHADGTRKSIVDILAEFEQRVFAAERAKK